MKKSKKPTLSISLLSSGRKKTIRKCLDSLKPIMEQIESELIIVDTGCDEETHNLLLEYTEQVVMFTWCNDFSKARNAGLELARGEWFLYLDDDEWFVDVEELVSFFKTGEYKNYAAANYIQRNYMDYEEKRYRDSWVSRMIRLDKDTRFESSIHEYVGPLKGACKLLHSVVKHFGYIFDTEKERYAHSRRNISLLVDMIKKESDNIRWWIQLAQEYRVLGESQKLQELCENGLKLMENKDDIETNRGRGTLYAGLIMAQVSSYNYTEAKRTLEKAFMDTRNTQVCMANLYNLGADLYYKECEYERCEGYCKKYIDIYNKLYGNEELLIRQSSFFVEMAFDIEIRNNMYCFLIGSCLKQGDTSALKEYFWKLGWEEDEIFLYISIVDDILNAFSELEFDAEFVKMAQAMVKRKGVEAKVLEFLRNKEAEGMEKIYPLCRIFMEVESPNYYIWYMKLLYADYNGEIEQIDYYFKEMVTRVNSILQLDDAVFEIVEKYQIDVDSALLECSFDDWKRSVDIYYREASIEQLVHRKKVFIQRCTVKNIRLEYFFLKVIERELLLLEQEETIEKMQKKLQEFTNRNLQFYGTYYRKSAFEGDMELLPISCRLAVKLYPVLAATEEGDIKKIRSCVKECFGIYPAMDVVIKKYVKLCVYEIEKQLQKEKKNTEEMRSLALQIKENIKILFGKQMYQEALQACKQIKNHFPDDEEILQLETQIEREIS